MDEELKGETHDDFEDPEEDEGDDLLEESDDWDELIADLTKD